MNHRNCYSQPHPDDDEHDDVAIFHNTPSCVDSFYIPPPHAALQSIAFPHKQHTQPPTNVTSTNQTQPWEPLEQKWMSAYPGDAHLAVQVGRPVQTTTNIPGASWPLQQEPQPIGLRYLYRVDHQNLAYQPGSRPMMEYSNNAHQTAFVLESTFPPTSTAPSYSSMEPPSQHVEPQSSYPDQQWADACPFHLHYTLEPFAATSLVGPTEPFAAYSEGHVEQAAPDAIDDPTYARGASDRNTQTRMAPHSQESPYWHTQQPFIAPIPWESRCSSLAGWANLPVATVASDTRPMQKMPRDENVTAYWGDEGQSHQSQDAVHHWPHHQDETRVHHHQQKPIPVPARADDSPRHLHHDSPPTISSSSTSSLLDPNLPTDLVVETGIDDEDTSASSPSGPSIGSAQLVFDFTIAVRPIGAVKMAAHIRQAAKLRVDVGRADIGSPSSHEARLAQRRLRYTGTMPTVAHSPYQRKKEQRHASVSSQGSTPGQVQLRQHLTPWVLPSPPPSSPATSPSSSFGAQQTFIFNPYQHPQIVAVADTKAVAYCFSPPVGSAVVVGLNSGADLLPRHQSIVFSESLDTKGIVSLDSPSPEKKPFLACGFCRQRKASLMIACGQRLPNERDDELPAGPRTCNQCARRHILCIYPTESHRGSRKCRSGRKAVDVDLTEIVVEDEGNRVEGGPLPEIDKKSPKKGEKETEDRMEWVIAVDAWLVTLDAWEAYLQTGTTEPTKGVNIVKDPCPGPSASAGEPVSMSDGPAADLPVRQEAPDADPSGA